MSLKTNTKHALSAIPMPSLETRRNMARALAKTGEFESIEIDRALNLPKITTAGFMAAASRYGQQVLDVREISC